MKIFIRVTLFILLCMNEYTFVNAMPTEEAKEQLSEQCPICYEVMDTSNTEQQLRNLSCNHIFHCKCINLWLRQNNTCPLCRGHKQIVEELIRAAQKGDIAAITQLLDQDADVNAQDNFGLTALYEAAEHGHLNVATLLLVHGADINAHDRYHGLTALHVATYKGYREFVALLLRAGANVNAQDRTGFTALHRAALGRGNREIATLLLNQGADATIQLEIATLLLNQGADATIQNERGETALDIAQAYGNPEMIQLLTQATTR